MLTPQGLSKGRDRVVRVSNGHEKRAEWGFLSPFTKIKLPIALVNARLSIYGNRQSGLNVITGGFFGLAFDHLCLLLIIAALFFVD